MKESFKPNQQSLPETVKLATADADGNEVMEEWEVSHSSGDMVYLKHRYDSGDDARFIYRGMSRARYAELGGDINAEAVANTTNNEQYVGDFTDEGSKAAKQRITDAHQMAEQAKQYVNDSKDRIKNAQQDAGSTNEAEESYEDNFKPFTVHVSRKLLSYADVRGNDAINSTFMLRDPSAVTYTQELIDISAEHSQNAVLDLQKEIADDYKKAVAELMFPRSSQSVEESRSWAIWDIAKQSYLDRHPEKSNENYKLADPFDPKHRAEKVREISSRHIGWEFEAAMNEVANAAVAHLSESERHSKAGTDAKFNALVEYVAKYAPVEKRIEVINLIAKAKNPMHSYEYTQLGELLRPAKEVPSKKKSPRNKKRKNSAGE